MPWKPRYSEADARSSIEAARNWREVLEALGYEYHGKTIQTVRKWAERWQISTEHLSDRRGLRTGPRRYSDAELRTAIAESRSWAETLRRLGYCPTGGNWKRAKQRAVD